ncbi:hypothetical protein, partial [Eubacterium barkeri]
MARKSKLKSELKNHNSTIKEKNEIASKVIAEEETKKMGEETVGLVDDLKKKVKEAVTPKEQDNAAILKEAAEDTRKKAEAETKAKADADAKKKADEEAKAKAAAEAKKKA